MIQINKISVKSRCVCFTRPPALRAALCDFRHFSFANTATCLESQETTQNAKKNKHADQRKPQWTERTVWIHTALDAQPRLWRHSKCALKPVYRPFTLLCRPQGLGGQTYTKQT